MKKECITQPLAWVELFLSMNDLSDLKSVYPILDKLRPLKFGQESCLAAEKLISHLLDEFECRYQRHDPMSREMKDIPSLLARMFDRIGHLDRDNNILAYFIEIPDNSYRVAVHAARIIDLLDLTDDITPFYRLEHKIIQSTDVSAAAAAYDIATRYSDIADTDSLIECIQRNAQPEVARGMVATIRSMDRHDQLGVIQNNCHEFSIAS